MVVRWLLVVVVVAGCFVLRQRVNAGDAETTQHPPGHNARSAENPEKTIGSPCEGDGDCTVVNSVCLQNKCGCISTYPVNIDNNQCLHGVHLSDRCDETRQCTWMTKHSHCDKHVCACIKGYSYSNSTNASNACVEDAKHPLGDEAYVDPTMIGVLVGLAAMFIVMCVVLRMFSKARFADNRTVFNSPRLLKLSLAAKRNDQRRASNVSMAGGSRPASRHASIQSGLNMLKKSPTNSQKGSKESIPQNSVHLKSGSPVKQEPLINVESPKDDKNTVVNIPDNSIAPV